MIKAIQTKKRHFSEFWGDSPISRVTEFLLESPEKEFTITEIAEGAGIGRTTLWEGNLLMKMANSGLIIKTREIGNSKLFKLNKNSHLVILLIDFYNKIKGEKNDQSKAREIR